MSIKKFLNALLVIVLAVMTLNVASEASESAKVKAGKIGIIGAMDIEVAALKESAEISRVITRAGMEFCEGRLYNTDIVIVKCGMGKVNAGICTQILIDSFKVSCVINTGIAGSLNDALDIGDVIIAKDVVQHDFDVTPINFQRGEIPYTGRYSFEADSKLRDCAMKAVKTAAPDIKVIEGRICTGDQFISKTAQKDLIKSNFNGDCCDMEGGAIGQVCYLNDIPFAIIRALSDEADDSKQVDFHEFEAEAARRCALITLQMIKELESVMCECFQVDS